MSNYFKVNVAFENEEIKFCENIENRALNVYQCDGIEDYSLGEEEIDKILGDKAYGGGNLSDEDINILEESVMLTKSIVKNFYFYQGDANERAQEFFDFLDKDYPSIKVVLEECEGEDWNESWRENFKPIIISSKTKIYPSWYKENQKEEDPSIVYIYPGQGFGTGGHETTFLCLQLLEDIIDKNLGLKTCLDFGCGSGILGITAIKKGISTVHFCDVDVDAIENCRQNFNHNEIIEDGEKTLSFLRDDFYGTQEYDLVFANIIQGILLKEKATITESTKHAGHLILSGLLKGQEEEIIQEFNDYKFLKKVEKGDWIALLMQKL